MYDNGDPLQYIRDVSADIQSTASVSRKRGRRFSKFFKKSVGNRLLVIFFSLILIAGIFYYMAFSSPAAFPSHAIISVREGAGLLEVADTLEEEQVIRSAFWFRNVAIFLGGERGLQAGDYYLSGRQNAYTIAKRIVEGEHDIEEVKITIPEGFTVKNISDLFDERFGYFDHSAFESTAEEGYMFPDTYFLPVSITASSTIVRLRENFETKITPLRHEIRESRYTLNQIIILASIVEAEATTETDRRIVAGIIEKRFDEDMPLQVDATLRYVTGRGSDELTQDDLNSDSPFNTYKVTGLPPAPIGNPGIESITAVLEPTETDNYYFLTGKEGEMHYAKTFEEHKKNREKYL